MTTTKNEIIAQIKAIWRRLLDEDKLREEIKQSRDYQSLTKEYEYVESMITDLTERANSIIEAQKRMLAQIEDSRPAYAELRKELLKIMEIEGIEAMELDGVRFAGRYSESRYVDGSALLNTLGGDIDEFMKLANITQKSIKDYAKDNEHLSRSLKSCIMLAKRELVDVDIDYSIIQE